MKKGILIVAHTFFTLLGSAISTARFTCFSGGGMKRIVLLAPIAIFVALPTGTGTFAKTTPLPIKIQGYLKKTYPGWKQTATATSCIPKFQQSVISGDFDGDGRRDYAVKFTQGNKGYIIAFLARGVDYSPYVLMDTTAQWIRNTGLSVGHKGQRDEDEEGRVSILRNDAPLIGTCESEACYFIYRNGNFRCE
jgi:hypothetical protein